MKIFGLYIHTHTTSPYIHKPNSKARTRAIYMMSPLIRIALAINLFSSSYTLRKLIKYSTHLHTLLKWIFNLFTNYLCYPLCKLQGSYHHQQRVCRYVSQSQDEEVDCAVCLCKVKEKEEIRVLKCEHVFHKDCLNTWFSFKYNNTSCPLCRVSVGPIRDLDTKVIHDADFQIPWLR